jgi:hypothetical protein
LTTEIAGCASLCSYTAEHGIDGFQRLRHGSCGFAGRAADAMRHRSVQVLIDFGDIGQPVGTFEPFLGLLFDLALGVLVQVDVDRRASSRRGRGPAAGRRRVVIAGHDARPRNGAGNRRLHGRKRVEGEAGDLKLADLGRLFHNDQRGDLDPRGNAVRPQVEARCSGLGVALKGDIPGAA